MSLQWEAQVVGINYYPQYTNLHNLTAAAKDAEEIATQLSDYGYETFRVQRLPGQPNQKGEWQMASEGEVKAKELEQAIANLFNPPDGNAPELALFFFSGHGWHKTVNGKEDVFLATSDVFPDDGEYGVSLSWLGEQIQNSPTKKVVVWLDCCYSGALLNYKPSDKDYCLISATRSYEPGIEIAHQQGLFTQTLQKALNPDHYADGIVDSHNLVKFIQKEMAQTEQFPQCATSERSILLTSKISKKAFRDECPYRSLNFFTEDAADALVFYGRTKLTQDLVEQIRTKKRLIAVFGASGSGKSSLIRAGLLYQLKLGQEIAGSNNWVYLKPFTPTDEPLAKLEEIEQVGWVDDKQMVMIIDQFEECFTMSDKEKRKAFIDSLTELMETKPNLYLIIGMRSDFRGRLREYPQFSEKMNKVSVEHLNHEEIQEAIEKPAAWVGLGIEGSLKQQLINDVEDYPGSLPLLQYTLTELWNETRKQGETFLRLATYRDLGGVEGTLEKRADKVYQGLSTEEQTVAKRVFLELTQVGDALDTRRRVRLGDLENSHHPLDILDRVTNKLADENSRLIIRDEQDSQDASDTIIDVVHEALIRHWPRLGEWKQQYQTAMAIERKIEESAQEWHEKGKKTDYLLQGSKLGVAEEYLKSYGDLAMLDGMAEKFITESRKRKGVVRRNWIIGGTAVSLVLIGLTIASTLSGREANHQKAIALKEKNNAQEQAQIAKEQAQIANNRSLETEQEKKRAEKALTKAEVNAKKAKEQANLAAKRFQEAQTASHLAEENEKKANTNSLEAKKQAEIAKDRSQEAEKEKLRAEKASIQAQKQADIAQEKTAVANNRQIDAEIGQIEALVSSSDALFKTNETFDALLTSVQAASKFQRFSTLRLNTRQTIQNRTI